MDNRLIGLKITKLRNKLNLTTTELAKMVGISQAQISRLENGKQGFRSATLTKIAGGRNQTGPNTPAITNTKIGNARHAHKYFLM